MAILMESLPLLSWSALQAYWSCPRRYAWRYQERLRQQDASAASERGQQVHAELHRHALGLSSQLASDPAEARLWQRYRAVMSSYAEASWQRSEWTLRVPFQTAEQAEIRAWLLGRCDRLLWQAGQLTLLDWKTGSGGPSEQSALQLRFYAWLLWQARATLPTPLTQIEVRAVWLEQEGVEQTEQLTPAALEALTESFAPLIEGCLACGPHALPAPRSVMGKIWCTLCEYQRLCPEGINHAPGYERPDLTL
ncbi:MAG: PD-(D/E)XK nuclease family protein [Candidatus Sericytochromatia bacterium]